MCEGIGSNQPKSTGVILAGESKNWWLAEELQANFNYAIIKELADT
jgi:hypothetical protein